MSDTEIECRLRLSNAESTAYELKTNMAKFKFRLDDAAENPRGDSRRAAGGIGRGVSRRRHPRRAIAANPRRIGGMLDECRKAAGPGAVNIDLLDRIPALRSHASRLRKADARAAASGWPRRSNAAARRFWRPIAKSACWKSFANIRSNGIARRKTAATSNGSMKSPSNAPRRKWRRPKHEENIEYRLDARRSAFAWERSSRKCFWRPFCCRK